MYQWFTVSSSTGALGKHEQTLSPLVDVNGTQQIDPNLILGGFTTVGPYDSSNPMDATTQAAWDNPQAYLYQNGAFVDNPNWTSIQLAQAKSAQVASIQAGYNAQLSAGFTSSANGTATVYGYATDDVKHMNMIASASALNVETWPIDYADIHGNIASLTQAQFSALVTDASKFNWAQLTQYRSFLGQIENATTIANVQSIVWIEASY